MKGVFQLYPTLAIGTALSLAVLVVSASCQTVRSGASQTQAATPSAPGKSVAGPTLNEVLYFRNLFRKFGAEASISDGDMQKAVLLPTAAMLSPSATGLAAKSAADANSAVLAQASSWTAANLYQNSLATPFSDVDISAPFGGGPATLIIVPGIFGEFIDKETFYELFQTPTSFSTTYQSALSQVQDPSYSLSASAMVNVPLSDRVHLGGSEAPNTQQPRVQAIFLKAGFGSGETLGDNAANAAIFLRRINKVFSQIPLSQCQNIYLVGYSQGTPVALEMISQAFKAPQQYPFLANLKGVVTLSGVLYGTEVSDDAYYNPNSNLYKTLQQLQTLLTSLTPAPSGGGFLTGAGQAVQSWSDLVALAQTIVSANPAPVPPGQQLENLASPPMNPAQIVDYIGHVFSDLIQPGLSPSTALANIQRAKLLLSEVIQGTQNLSTKERAAWWASHTLPSTLPIYSVATSMPDASTPTFTSPLLSSAYFGPPTVDYQTVLRPGFYSLLNVSQVPMNDSQVVTAKQFIYPDLVQAWNPAQQPFPTHLVGIMGTHHWGIAFPNVFDTTTGASNSFPRRAFAEALSAFLLTTP